ncbi:MAG: Tol-Pal system beta propeller repeat protein TolB [Gammaproteobacteria bacterium]|nr:Tol-Pal system beta propeller repeat protein TolB [Gammaproteobacteria bacterium]
MNALTQRFAFYLLTLVALPSVHAQMAVVIDQGADNPIRIAVVPFTDLADASERERISDIVSRDLVRSGQFSPLAVTDMLSLPRSQDEVFFRDWRISAVDYLVIGDVQRTTAGDLVANWSLIDVLGERVLWQGQVIGGESKRRDIAHRISDVVYESITGVEGAFSTKLLYVLVQDAGTSRVNYRLELADADGARAVTLLESNEPILSPSFSPDASSVVFVWFQGGRSGIYQQWIASGEQRLLARFQGINTSPVFSPDGTRLALVSSRDGNPEIYTLDLSNPSSDASLVRLTRHQAIDTEPDWLADGSGIVFTSDRGGQPQIYLYDFSSVRPERLTFQGDYNTRARSMPTGDHIAFIHRIDNRYHLVIKDLARDPITILTETALDESPAVAPNAAMLIYATKQGNQGILAVVSTDGAVKYRLPSAIGDVREPAWSPQLAPVVRTVEAGAE